MDETDSEALLGRIEGLELMLGLVLKHVEPYPILNDAVKELRIASFYQDTPRTKALQETLRKLLDDLGHKESGQP